MHDAEILKTVLLEALECAPAARPRLLDERCGDDALLRRRVEDLLAAHDRAAALPVPAEALEAEEERDGARIGPYELRGRIGEGGFGVVHRALQLEPVRREVALKLVKAGMGSREVLARFAMEQQALALMDHPGITKVFDAGVTPRGRPYFAMELVDGPAITAWCDERRLGLPERLALFESVCLAVHHAHQKGVIHRDLKPSNVLVAEVDGRPVAKVIDFGIARALGSALGPDTRLTAERQVLGTPQYMAPEIAAAGAGASDARSDIYALGVLLYELVAGAPPFDERRLRDADLLAVLRMIRDEEPARPSTRLRMLPEGGRDVAARRGLDAGRLERTLRGDLDWIVLRAIEKDPARRYPSAAALAADVRRHLADEPLEAGPPSAAYRLAKLYRRHRVLAWSAAVLAAVLVGATILSTTLAAVADRARRDAERLRDVAERRAYAAEVYAAQAALADNDALGAAHHLERSPEGLRGWEWRHLSALVDESRRVWRRPDGAAATLAISPDGAWFAGGWADGALQLGRTLDGADGPLLTPHDALVTAACFADAGRILFSGDDAGGILVHATATGARLVSPERAGGRIARLAASADGRVVIAATWDGTARLLDGATGAPRGALPGHGVPLHDALLSADGTRAVITAFDNRTRIWSVPDGTLLAELRTQDEDTPDAPPERFAPGRPMTLALHPDGRRALVGHADGAVALVDLEHGEIVRRFRGQAALVRDAAISPDGTLVAVASNDRVVRLWSIDDSAPIGSLLGHDDAVRALSFVGDGALLVTASWDRSIRVWSVADGLELTALHGHDAGVYRALPTPDGTRLASYALDGTIRLWDLEKARRRTLPGHAPLLFSVAFALDGATIVAGETEGSARSWRLEDAHPQRRLDADGAGVLALAVAPDGRTIATGSRHGRVSLWAAEDGTALERHDLGDDDVRALAFSPDGAEIAAAVGRAVVVLERATGTARLRLEGHDEPVRAVCFDARRDRILSGGQDGELRMWNDADGRPLGAMPSPGGGWVMSLAIDPSGSRLAIGAGRTIRILDLERDALQFELRGHAGEVGGLAWLPDGSRLVSGAADRTVRLWDMDHGELVGTLTGHARQVRAVAVSPDGRHIASAGEDGTVRLWSDGTR